MFKRILHIVSEKQQEKRLVAELAKANDSAVMLAAMLLVGCGHEVSAEGATRRRVLREERERSCWQALYRLEEEFKASGIKASVMAREGDIDDIHTLANNVNADLIVLHASSLAGANFRLPDEFIASLPCPIVIVNPE